MRELAALAAHLPGSLEGARARALAAALFSPEFRAREPQRVRELLAYFARHRAGAAGLGAHWWASVYHDTWSRLPGLRRPTLVVHGGADGLTPLASAQRLASRIPGAELAVVPGAGHAYMLEQPQLAYDLFAGWLDRQGPIGPGEPPSRLAARVEPLHRGLPAGALRTGRSALEVLTRRLGAAPLPPPLCAVIFVMWLPGRRVARPHDEDRQRDGAGAAPRRDDATAGRG